MPLPSTRQGSDSVLDDLGSTLGYGSRRTNSGEHQVGDATARPKPSPFFASSRRHLIPCGRPDTAFGARRRVGIDTGPSFALHVPSRYGRSLLPFSSDIQLVPQRTRAPRCECRYISFCGLLSRHGIGLLHRRSRVLKAGSVDPGTCTSPTRARASPSRALTSLRRCVPMRLSLPTPQVQLCSVRASVLDIACLSVLRVISFITLMNLPSRLLVRGSAATVAICCICFAWNAIKIHLEPAGSCQTTGRRQPLAVRHPCDHVLPISLRPSAHPTSLWTFHAL